MVYLQINEFLIQSLNQVEKTFVKKFVKYEAKIRLKFTKFDFQVILFSSTSARSCFPRAGARDSNYDEYLRDLWTGGPDECRYGLYDFEYEHQCQGTTETTKKEKLLLMSWCPDTAKIKKKMLYSSSFDALKKCLVGVQKYIQVRIKSGQE